MTDPTNTPKAPDDVYQHAAGQQSNAPGPTQSTYEEATRCPQCGKPGEVVKQETIPPATARRLNLQVGTQIHHVICQFALCPWYDTAPWIVQVNPDGSVPPKTDHRGAPKHYVGDFGTPEEAKRLIDALKAQAERETKEHAEVQRPRDL
jgi:hypothetical protein